jgi:transposase
LLLQGKTEAKTKMRLIINEPRMIKPEEELAQLGSSLHKRLGDVLVFFDVGISNGSVKAVKGRLKLLRGIVLVFRILVHSGRLTRKIYAL